MFEVVSSHSSWSANDNKVTLLTFQGSNKNGNRVSARRGDRAVTAHVGVRGSDTGSAFPNSVMPIKLLKNVPFLG